MASASQDIRQAIESGATPEEIEQLVAQRAKELQGEPEDQQRAFNDWLYTLEPEYISAFQGGLLEGGDITTGVAPIFGGKSLAEITYKTGAEAGKTVSYELGKQALSQNGQSLLTKAMQFLGRHKLATGLGLGAASIPFFGGVDETAPGGQTPEGGQVFTPEIEQRIDGLQNEQGLSRNEAIQALANSPNARIATSVRQALGYTAAEARNRLSYNPPTVSTQPEQPSPGSAMQLADPGYNIMVVDHSGDLTGTPGAVAVVSSKDIGLQTDPTVQQQINVGQAVGGELTDMLQQFLSQAAGSALADRDVYQILFPESVGEVSVDVPFQALPSTNIVRGDTPFQALRPEQTEAERQRSIFEEGTGQTPAPTMETTPASVPAGAKINPRIFNQYQGRTLLEWANISAQRHGVPLNLLYGIVQHESGWNPSIRGDNGQSRGLAQIFQPAWPNISDAQAFNPVFALEWTAQKLRQRFNQYGRWDAAVAAHNHPAAAEYLARTGRFMTEKSASYVGSVTGKANASGLANWLFDEGQSTPVAGTGPTYTPFQAPDPAASREYIGEVYEQLLGRAPTDDELASGVDKINALARQAYNANLKQAKGGESQEVDLESRFEESIKETGEFQFHEENVEQRSFTDYAAGIARVLQEGF